MTDCAGRDCPVEQECAEQCTHACHRPTLAYRPTVLGRPITRTPVGATCHSFRWTAVVRFEELTVPGETRCGNCGVPVERCGFDSAVRDGAEQRVLDDALDRRVTFPAPPAQQRTPRVWP